MERLVDINQILRDCACDNIEQILRLYNGHCKDNKSIVSHVTNSLGNRNTVNEGLVQLGILLPKCTTEILLENGMIWIVSCVRACENDDVNIRNLAYLLLAALFSSLSKLPDFTKLISNNSISKLIECIIKDECLLTSLYCLEACLEHIPGICGHYKTNLEKHLLNYVQETNKSKVLLAAKCLHLLQQTSGGGAKGVNHKANWEKQFHMSVNSLHSLMDILYANTMEIVARSNDELLLNLPTFHMPDNPAHQISEVSKRFNNLCCFIQVMLTEPFPVAKRVQPDILLHAINRGLVVTGKTLQRVSTDNIILNAFLPDIHESLLKTLDALLFCAGRNLINYAHIIINILMRVLHWTQDVGPSPHRRIRVAAYETLISWMKISNLSSFIEQHASDIISSIMLDITPRKTQVKLGVPNENNIKNDTKPVLTQELHSDEEMNEKLCGLALDCFQQVLASSGLFMKPPMQKSLQATVANILLRLQAGQYDNTVYTEQKKCRKSLYRVFYGLVLHPSSRFPPPTHEAVIIFSRGQLDSDYEIADMCREMLCSIKKIIQTNSLNSDENKGLLINQPETADSLPNKQQPSSNSIPIPTMAGDEAITLDSTDISASDAEVDVYEHQETSMKIVTNDENNFAEPNILTSVNCTSVLNGSANLEESTSPMLLIPNDEEIEEVPVTKRRKLSESNNDNNVIVPLPSCEEIVKDLKEKKEDMMPIITDVVSVAENDMMISSAEPIISETVSVSKLPEPAVANLSVDEMMSSFVSEINDDI